jgi:hypothetical protein
MDECLGFILNADITHEEVNTLHIIFFNSSLQNGLKYSKSWSCPSQWITLRTMSSRRLLIYPQLRINTLKGKSVLRCSVRLSMLKVRRD